MQFLIIYATTEGQTHKIARFAQRHLARAGHAVELLSADAALDGPIDYADYDGVLVMASVHAGTYQPSVVALASRDGAALDRVHHAFISVSLSAAGTDPEDWEGLRDVVEEFTTLTGWTPKTVEHVAGAFRFSRYNWFKHWAMRYIKSQKDPTGGAGGDDVEYTDWDALAAFLDRWAAEAGTKAA